MVNLTTNCLTQYIGQSNIGKGKRGEVVTAGRFTSLKGGFK